jgi:hypothetical protein
MTQVLAPEHHAPTPAVGRSNDRLWHLAFGALLAITLIAFTLWSFDFVGRDAPRMVLITTVIFGAFMAFNIGGNDVANAFGTSVGAGTLTMKQALLVAAVFEVSGALLAGGDVTDTVKSGNRRPRRGRPRPDGLRVHHDGRPPRCIGVAAPGDPDGLAGVDDARDHRRHHRRPP